MKSEKSLNAKSYVADLAARGRNFFSSREAQIALGVSALATRRALRRLAEKGEISSPARGYYVIVPPEYRRLGGPPPDQFIPQLMQAQGHAYYVGLLSAAQYHGAAHQRPQALQVFLAKPHRPIAMGSVRVHFFAHKRLADVKTQDIKTPAGTIRVSTPEATAIDLVGFAHQAGGLSNVATVLTELAEAIDPARLLAAAPSAPIPWVQRLGYLLELVGAADKVQPLKDYVRKHAINIKPLAPSNLDNDAPVAADWKLRINSQVEPDE